jgi:ectoine hydroxylase-related dioxygenase (phytanoyl-CoA dioxygenase family)
MGTTAGAGSRCLLDNEWCQTLASTLQNRVSSTVTEIRSLVAVQCTFFNKSPDSNWFVAFHQDRSIPVASSVAQDKWSGWSCKEGMTFIHGPDTLLAKMLALRLHIDKSGPDNGPLRVIPNSHKSGTLSRRDIDAIRDSSSDQTLTARKGGVVLMRPLLLHASSKSRTMESRRVLHFLFGPQTLPDGLEWRRAV